LRPCGGAYDYLFKPLDLHQLRRVVAEAVGVARRMRAPAAIGEPSPSSDGEGAIVGSGAGTVGVFKVL